MNFVENLQKRHKVCLISQKKWHCQKVRVGRDSQVVLASQRGKSNNYIDLSEMQIPFLINSEKDFSTSLRHLTLPGPFPPLAKTYIHRC